MRQAGCAERCHGRPVEATGSQAAQGYRAYHNGQLDGQRQQIGLSLGHGGWDNRGCPTACSRSAPMGAPPTSDRDRPWPRGSRSWRPAAPQREPQYSQDRAHGDERPGALASIRKLRVDSHQ